MEQSAGSDGAGPGLLPEQGPQAVAIRAPPVRAAPSHCVLASLGGTTPPVAAPPSAGFLSCPLPAGRRLAQLPRLTDDINTARLGLSQSARGSLSEVRANKPAGRGAGRAGCGGEGIGTGRTTSSQVRMRPSRGASWEAEFRLPSAPSGCAARGALTTLFPGVPRGAAALWAATGPLA